MDKTTRLATIGHQITKLATERDQLIYNLREDPDRDLSWAALSELAGLSPSGVRRAHDRETRRRQPT